ncbi:MAG: 3-hydroxyacyl-CoA dehydrogenase NAD-binding domain-containing protein [Bacteroidota bacterium]
MNISVIGAGTMGNGIAHVFALKGHQVQLVDISDEALEGALQTIEKNLRRMASKELIPESAVQASLSQINTITDLSEGVAKADLVVEAATEREDLKLSIFETIDRAAPVSAILASNTSSISITKIATATHRPAQVIGMHFFNPVPVMKLVEVIRGYSTSDETTRRVMALSQDLGKIPVEVNDYPGFAANRILMPMINEAIKALNEGVAGVEQIDTVMKLGMAHPMGPLQLADFVGLDVCVNICRVMQEGLGDNRYAPNPLLVRMVTAGKLGRKSGEGFYDYSHGGKQLVVASSFL